MKTNVTFALVISTILVSKAWTQVSDPERQKLRRTPVVEVFDACKDAVVNISTTQVIQVRSPFDDFDRLFNEMFDSPLRQRQGRQFKTTAVGSGFVIHPSGYIVTNAHVVARTAERKVIFSDKREYDAQVIAMAAEIDLAVLKIEADKPLVTLPFGQSDDLLIGETVIAIGNPLGLQNTVTSGVISALDRTLEVNNQAAYTGLIQTDASINPGNSGGPLLNVLGELIGVNTAIRGDAQNIGFAIPVQKLHDALPDLLDVERRYRIICGAKVGGAHKPKITEVKAGTPAAEAGVRVGDVPIRIDGHYITKAVDFSIGLIGKKGGESVQLVLQRAGKPVTVTLRLQAKPKPDGAKLAWDKYGMEVQEMSPEVANKLGLPNAQGLIVTRLDAKGPAENIGLEPADIVVEIGRHQPASLDDLGLLLETIASGQKQRIGVLRVGNRALYRLTAEITAR